jgi:hypothetical protein
MRKRLIVGILVAWLLSVGCQAPPGDTSKSKEAASMRSQGSGSPSVLPPGAGQLKDAASMKAVLQKRLPVGTSLGKARLFMEQEGFKCSLAHKESFSEEGVVREGIDFLYCDRDDRVGVLVIRRWQVALVLSQDSVSEVLVSVGLIGP